MPMERWFSQTALSWLGASIGISSRCRVRIHAHPCAAKVVDVCLFKVVKPITGKARPSGENVVDLMEALRRSVGGAAAETQTPKKPAKKSKKAWPAKRKC